jgi:nitrogen fixation protein NifQ
MRTDAHIRSDSEAEYEALRCLLLEHADPVDEAAENVASHVARASLEPGHLWRTMGLVNRSELRTLLFTHFPTLAAGNTKDMRWKKYLYKRLCGWPGFDG